MQGEIKIRDLCLHLGKGEQRFQALDHVNIHIPPSEFVCLLGPSGCGKSTLLGALAGHLSYASGDLLVDNEIVHHPHPDRGLVFQHHTLFPWKSIIENIAFGLKMKGIPVKERLEKAKQMIDLVGLTGFEKKFPAELSGGMQQRVEIARVLINEPKVLLMDEPFGALDPVTRIQLQDLLVQISAEQNRTVVFVTHDVDEAIYLADRIVIFAPSKEGAVTKSIDVPFRHKTKDRQKLFESTEFRSFRESLLNEMNEQILNSLNAEVSDGAGI